MMTSSGTRAIRLLLVCALAWSPYGCGGAASTKPTASDKPASVAGSGTESAAESPKAKREGTTDGVRAAHARYARLNHALALSAEFDGIAKNKTDLQLGRVAYRPSLQYTYLFMLKDYVGLAFNAEFGAWLAQEDYLGRDLHVGVSQFWAGLSPEVRVILGGNCRVALHTRVRISGGGARLVAEDRTTKTKQTDWTPGLEVAPIIGLRAGSLFVFEAGWFWTRYKGWPHIDDGAIPNPLPRSGFFGRVGLEYRFGGVSPPWR